jgi:hypothetical protein
MRPELGSGDSLDCPFGSMREAIGRGAEVKARERADEENHSWRTAEPGHRRIIASGALHDGRGNVIDAHYATGA